MGHVGHEGSGIEVAAQTARRQHHGHAVVVELPGEIVDELRALAEILHVERLVESLRHRLHRAHVDAAIGEEALVERDVLHHLLCIFGILRRDDAALGETQLAGGEIDDVEMVGKEVVDFPWLHKLAARLTGLHEIYVVLEQGSVEHRLHAHLMADVGDGEHILQRHGLAANEVGARLHTHERHPVGSYLLDALAQVLQVEVALEGVVALGEQALGVDQLLHGAAETGDVCLGRGEVEVHQRHHAGLHERLGEDVLAGSSLVGGQHVLRAEHLLHSRLHAVEGLGAGIGIVGLHHRPELQIGHGVHTRVGEHVHVNILVLQEEGVVACLLYLLQTVLNGQKRELLYHSHLVHFEWHLVLTLIEFYCHFWFFVFRFDCSIRKFTINGAAGGDIFFGFIYLFC